MNVIGIDFGSQENKIGFFEQTQLQLFTNEFGNYSTPSYICFQSDGNHFFGKQAQLMAVQYPKDTIFDTKRMLGRKFSDLKKEETDRWPFTIKDGGNDNIIIVTESYGEHDPIEITGLIIKDLLQIANEFEKETDKVVISIPGYFNKYQQHEMKIAATKYAGIKNLTLICEPVAATIWHSFWLSQFKNEEDDRDIILFDIGAESLNFCGLNVDQTNEIIDLNVMMIKANLNVGGIFLDQEIYNYVLPQFEQKANLTEKDKRKILRSCEEAKIKLSSSEKAQVSCEIDDQLLKVDINRQMFKQFAHNVLSKSTIIPEIRNLISKDNEDNKQFDILINGSLINSPVIQDVLSDLIGKKVTKPTNPEEFIVKGACIIAANIYLSSQLIDWKNIAQANGDTQKYKTFQYIERIPHNLDLQSLYYKSSKNSTPESNNNNNNAQPQIPNAQPYQPRPKQQIPPRRSMQEQNNQPNLSSQIELNKTNRASQSQNHQTENNQTKRTRQASRPSNIQTSNHSHDPHRGSQKQKIRSYTKSENHESSPSNESLVKPDELNGDSNEADDGCCGKCRCLLI
ncbi:Heat shock protein ssb1 [Tritrichomonas musculus]|uniref:Heat shock protein ssb1 n=1 Tax=Tritrichomonas musculus TaxID=1915356 RepID=A0ABR2IL59_9EUKA